MENANKAAKQNLELLSPDQLSEEDLENVAGGIPGYIDYLSKRPKLPGYGGSADE